LVQTRAEVGVDIGGSGFGDHGCCVVLCCVVEGVCVVLLWRVAERAGGPLLSKCASQKIPLVWPSPLVDDIYLSVHYVLYDM
jgi:hypothetical protein